MKVVFIIPIRDFLVKKVLDNDIFFIFAVPLILTEFLKTYIMKEIKSLDHLFEIIDFGVRKLVLSREFDLSTYIKRRQLAVNFIFYLLASPKVTEFCFNNKVSRKDLEDHALQEILFLYECEY